MTIVLTIIFIILNQFVEPCRMTLQIFQMCSLLTKLEMLLVRLNTEIDVFIV